MTIEEIDIKIKTLEFESFTIKYRVNTNFDLTSDEYNKLIHERIRVKNDIKILKNKRNNVLKNMVRKYKLEKIIKTYENNN